MQTHTFAAIDIGSNAIRLLIKSVEEYSDKVEYKKLAFLRVPIRLGEDVFTDGKISAEKRARLCEAMQGFAHVMCAYRVEAFRACATSAMREASNGSEVTQQVRELSGINIEIISGQAEAETIFANGMSETVSPELTYLYVDVGGGSTEVVVYSRHRKVEARSFGLGTVRMLSDAVDKNEMKSFKKWLASVAKKYQPTAIIGSGGNINKVQRLLNKKEKESLNYTEVEVLYRYITSFNFEERVHALGLNTYRADVIVPAMKIFITVCNTCKINEIIVPKMGLSDGIIRTLFNEKVASRA